MCRYICKTYIHTNIYDIQNIYIYKTYMCIYNSYIYIETYIYTERHIYIWKHTYIYIETHIYMQKHTHIYIETRIYIYRNIYIYLRRVWRECKQYRVFLCVQLKQVICCNTNFAYYKHCQISIKHIQKYSVVYMFLCSIWK